MDQGASIRVNPRTTRVASCPEIVPKLGLSAPESGQLRSNGREILSLHCGVCRPAGVLRTGSAGPPTRPPVAEAPFSVGNADPGPCREDDLVREVDPRLPGDVLVDREQAIVD